MKTLSEAEEAEILRAIEAAEKETSGEIRVHVESRCPGAPIERAVELFEKLGMHQTELRNGVLIYVAFEDHKLSIIGDRGINEKVPEGFWDEALEAMRSHFKQQQFASGIAQAVKMAGQQLRSYFPWKHNDSNELPNSISKS